MINFSPNGRVVFSDDFARVTGTPRAERFAPEVVAHCHRCGRDTATTFRLMSSGHVGNLCAECGTCRLGRPYVSRSHLNTPMPQSAAEGSCNGHTHR